MLLLPGIACCSEPNRNGITMLPRKIINGRLFYCNCDSLSWFPAIIFYRRFLRMGGRCFPAWSATPPPSTTTSTTDGRIKSRQYKPHNDSGHVFPKRKRNSLNKETIKYVISSNRNDIQLRFGAGKKMNIICISVVLNNKWCSIVEPTIFGIEIPSTSIICRALGQSL